MYACLKVLLMWSWGGERAAPGLLGPEPCGGDPASTWCWVGQWQVQLEVVLRVGMCRLSGYAETTQWEGCFQKPCVSQQQQGREGCVGVVCGMLGFPQRCARVGVIAFGCRQEGEQEGSGLLCPLQNKSLNTASPSPLAQEMGHEWVLSMQRCRQVPTSFLTGSRIPWSCQPEARLAVGSRAEYIPVMG